MDECRALMKILTNIKGLMVLGRNIEEVRDLILRMVNFNSFGSSQQGTDL
jgi:hypothetical protein